ncbi:hypothetical protein Q4610_07685 [Sphingobium sp. HBC34]|uniref:Uncharacterized protein n=1 Tax=Sphingobium cyanobacteriorum TaxID=3063954 RepID=A0ABT8ZK65_9SPHN|nr:hypothetical protein [Sphingobium sp. HBC34]MDO7834927.1 hypothetical protein [Sphingobium sp. HBC34]
MVRRTSPQTPPNQATPSEQPLVTPALGAMPEMLLALQQAQAAQALNSECAAIRQELGILKAEVANAKTAIDESAKDISGIKRVHHIVVGAFLVISVALGLVWWAIGGKVTTLLKMADERQVADDKKK